MNELSVNLLLKSIESEHLLRVLWISTEREGVYLFNCETLDMPELVRYVDLQKQIDDGLYEIQEKDPYFVTVNPEKMSENKREARDTIWSLMAPLVTDEPRILDKRGRNQIIAETIVGTGKTRATLHRYLKTYWQRGKTQNAFIPDFHKRGGKGVEHRSGAAKIGRPRKYGDSVGANVDDAVKTVFESTIKKHYHTRDEHTLQHAYDMMIKEHYTRFVLQDDGGNKAELLPADQIPTIGQFRYWYGKKYSETEKLMKRKGETKFALEHRAITGKSDFGIMGPCAKYQIDATIGDIYLVSRFNRADIIGRPVIYFVIDVYSRMVAGMYIGLEGPSWAGSMMAIANACSDKVKYCAEYGIAITEEEWPCRYVPNAILGDRGEMESKFVETLIATLNVRIENAPPYRGDMKGIIEQHFNRINTSAVERLPGYVKQDTGERGSKDYRLGAILDIHQLTKVLIECVLHHNNKHLLEKYERTADMIADDVPPVPLMLWNWGISHCSGLPRSYPEDAVKLALMPMDSATVTAKGIRFKGLYYISERAVSERWFETARAKGSFKADISYDPRNMSRIYVRGTDGNVDPCHLTEWQEKYTDKCLDEIIFLHESEKQAQHKHSRQEMVSKTDLSTAIDSVVAEAEEMARQTAIPKTNAERTKNIRDNRRNEKDANRRGEAFVLGGNDSIATVLETAAQDEPEPITPALAMIMQQLEERLNEK